MNTAEKKFRLYAILVIFVLLTVLLSVINGVNFTMAAGDADRLTEMLSERKGSFERKENLPAEAAAGGQTFRFGPMGPGSPEMNASLRYFTIAFPEKSTKAETVAFHISAVTEEEAKTWAESLLKQKTGWTRGTYRYRVYKDHGMTYVTVIDQGRELLPSFRILIISAVGEVLVLIISWFVLGAIGKKVYAPLREADRKQKSFLKSANKEFRLPLTIISGNTELAERKYGPDNETRSTRRQIAKMTELLDKLGTVGFFEEEKKKPAMISLSEQLQTILGENKAKFEAKGIALMTEIAPDVQMTADPKALQKALDELVENALNYAVTKARFTLKKESGVTVLETGNDTSLPDGPADQVFDRFTKLENAKDGRPGLGLSYVKEVVRALNGRVTASVSGGIFTVSITL